MKNVTRQDIHKLIPRFAPLRLQDPKGLQKLARSIEANGQLTPVIAVPSGDESSQWVLIDGYRRLEALHAMGEDRIWVEIWEQDVLEALLCYLARGQDRPRQAIEEAALLGELTSDYSQHEIARRIGRDVSWVSRRLSLYRDLPDDLLQSVRQGKISLWAATRILTPLARANSDHARRLLSELEQQPLSTRELKQVYEGYQRSNRTQRQRMIENPELYLKAVKSRQEAACDKRLADGPEGAWRQTLVKIAQSLDRLFQQIPLLFTPQQEPLEKQRLQQNLTPITDRFRQLEKCIEEACSDDSL